MGKVMVLNHEQHLFLTAYVAAGFKDMVDSGCIMASCEPPVVMEQDNDEIKKAAELLIEMRSLLLEDTAVVLYNFDDEEPQGAFVNEAAAVAELKRMYTDTEGEQGISQEEMPMVLANKHEVFAIHKLEAVS